MSNGFAYVFEKQITVYRKKAQPPVEIRFGIRNFIYVTILKFYYKIDNITHFHQNCISLIFPLSTLPNPQRLFDNIQKEKIVKKIQNLPEHISARFSTCPDSPKHIRSIQTRPGQNVIFL